MEKKIFKGLSWFWVGILIFLMVLMTGLLYGILRGWVFEELQEKIHMAATGVEYLGEKYLQSIQSEERFTWIAEDGTVLYDTLAEASFMENHAGRPEVQQALLNGSAEAIHASSVVLLNTLYYAQRLSDGTILRLSCTQSVGELLLYPLIWPVLSALAVILLLSALYSAYLSRQVMRPINEMDMEDLEKNPSGIYPELTPFLQRLRQQQQTIRQQNRKLLQHQEEFSAITGNMSEGFILTDNQANVLSYNRSALRLLDARPDGDGRWALMQNKLFREVTSEALCGRRMEQLQNIQDRCCQFIATPVIRNGQISGAVIVILDVTEKEQRERLRREFTANVSHELKTPLTSISGFAEIIRAGFTEPDATREFAGDIYNESQRLITLVNDIIRLSELDEGALEAEKEKVNLYQIALDVMEQLRPAAEKSSVQLELEGKAVWIAGVSQILEEMIFNLCDNAVKYNRPGGSVKIKIAREKIGVRLSVADDGIGIPKSAQSRVFERFYRVDKSHSRAIGGTGLGLSIVKHGAACHHAEIEMESEEGKGTCVTLIFP